MLTPPSKRLAKRSILGTRVAVRGDDGKFYAGMIQATKTCEEGESSSAAASNSGGATAHSEAAGTSAEAAAASAAAENRYSVRLDTTRKVKEFAESEIVGPGFGSVAGNTLCAGQIVYVTHMNREVQGAVLHHGKESVVIQLFVSTHAQRNHSNNHRVLKVKTLTRCPHVSTAVKTRLRHSTKRLLHKPQLQTGVYRARVTRARTVSRVRRMRFSDVLKIYKKVSKRRFPDSINSTI